jgi:O-antigen/teichoic acid export membrane protein
VAQRIGDRSSLSKPSYEKEKMNNQNVSTRSQLYWNTLLQVPSQIIAFVISIVIARILNPKDFGIMGIAMMLIGYANLFTNFGFSEAIIQKRIKDNKTLDSIFTINLIVSLILALLFYVSANYIAIFFKSPECENVIKVLSSFFIITSFSAVPSALLRRDMNFKTISLLDLSGSFLMSFVTLILALIHFEYWALVFGQLIPTVLITIILCIRVGWIPTITYEHSSIRGILNFGGWNFFRVQWGFAIKHIDRFIIGRWLGTTNLGFYEKSLSIAMLPFNSITMNINAVMFSAFSNNQDKIDFLQNHFKKSLTLISIIIFPIYFGLICISSYFVHVFLGYKWVPMITSFQIILIGCTLNIFSGLTASLNIGMGNYKIHTLLYVLSSIIFIFCCFIFIRFGLIGIAISYLLFMLTSNLFTLLLSLSKLNIPWKDFFYSVSPGLSGSIIMFIALQLLANYIFEEYSYLNLISLILSGAIIYLIYIFINKAKAVKEIRSKIIIDVLNFKQSFKFKNE